MTDQELRYEVRLSLPSQKMTDYPNVSAVINPFNGKLVILKCRYDKAEEEKLTVEDFEFYTGDIGWRYDYKELHGKNIIFDSKLLSKRGLEALGVMFATE